MKVKNENAGLLGSIKGILGGFVFIIISVVLLWWNEGNNVRNIKAVEESSSSFIQVESNEVKKENEGKLISTYGELKTDETLVDEMFDVSLNTINLERIVEMYQWVEESHDTDDGYTEYNYKLEWKEEFLDSSNYQDTTKVNPTNKLFDSVTYTAHDVNVGAFKLSYDQISRLGTTKDYTSLNNEVAERNNLKLRGNYYVNYDETPKVGDIRISFKYNDSKDASVLAVQTGNSFTDFISSTDKRVNLVDNGIKTGEELLNDLKESNNILKWILRAVGTLFCIVGIATILKPITVLGNYVPILGNIVSGAIGLVSLLLGLAISFVVIAIAWIRFRPIIGICLLAAVVGLIILLKMYSKKKQAVKKEENVVTPVNPVENVATPVNPVENVNDNNQNNNVM